MIPLKQINGNTIDLSRSSVFCNHYAKPNTFAKHIIETEINTGLWYDDILFDLKEDSVIVDAGANVGLWTLYMLPKIKQVICLEPTNSHIAVLLDVVNVFKIPAIVLDVALANHNGYCGFESNQFNSTMNKIGEGNNKQCSTLKKLLEYAGTIDLLKLDIEGAEQQVILEDETISEGLANCKVVYIETHPKPYGDTDEVGIIYKMKSLGFTHKKANRDLAHYFIR